MDIPVGINDPSLGSLSCLALVASFSTSFPLTNLKDLAFNVVVSILNVLDLDALKEWLPTDNVGYVNVFPENRGISVKHLWKDREKVLSEILLFDKSRNQNYKDYLHPDLVEWL